MCCFRDYGVTLSDRELDTVLGAFDRNKDGKIDFDEFLRGIRVRSTTQSLWPDVCGLNLSSVLGFASVRGLSLCTGDTAQGNLSARRRALVMMAYDQLDRDGSGVVNVDDIRGAFDTSKHPDVITGAVL